jgi:hypothetical protein
MKVKAGVTVCSGDYFLTFSRAFEADASVGEIKGPQAVLCKLRDNVIG